MFPQSVCVWRWLDRTVQLFQLPRSPLCGQAVGFAESGCRGVVQWRGEGLVGERAAAYEVIEVSSRRFEIRVYDPERTELEVSGVEDNAVPDLVGEFDAVKGAMRAGAWNAARSTSRPRKGSAQGSRAVEGVGRVLGGKQDFGANITKLFNGATDREKARPHR
jgi:hypothetical protein